MMQTSKYFFIFFLLICSITCGTNSSCARSNITNLLEPLGNPYTQYYPKQSNTYARNIWDMRWFKGKLYLGAGNSSNYGPSPNAGPAPIIAYDPETDSFTMAFTTSDEQVDTFFLFNNALYVPGHDPQESWNLGNLYKTTNGEVWLKKRTIPHAIHTYCLQFLGNTLFAGLGTQKGAAIATSENFGDSWKLSRFKQIGRFYNFLKVNKQLFAISTLMDQKTRLAFSPDSNNTISEVVEYLDNGKFKSRPDITKKQLFPDTVLDKSKICKIVHSHSIKEQSIYIGATIHNDHQFIPFGLYTVESLKRDAIKTRRVNLPKNAIPWDIYSSGEYVYVLTNEEKNKRTETTILRSNNLTDWEELFYFESPTLTRSFAYYQGTFYFSFGSEIKDMRHWKKEKLSNQTGEILKFAIFSVPP